MAESVEDRLLGARLAQATEAEEDKSFIKKAYEYISGAESEGYPELGTSGPSIPAMSAPGLKMMGAYATQVDPKSIADIAEKALANVDPDVKQGRDRYGNPTITFEGQTYYVNAPGLSEADAFQLLGQIGLFAPATKVGAAGRGVFNRMLRTGVLSATTSVGADIAGQAMGSEQDIDWWRAGLTGAIGGAMEGLAPAVKYGWRTIFSKPRYFDEATGKLTEEGIRVAREAGLDPVDMDRRLAAAFAREVTDEPVPALAKTRAYEEAYGFPYTRGQQLAQAGEFEQVAREEGMRHGVRGGIAKGEMVARDEMARQQTQEAIDRAIGLQARPMQETGEELLSGVRKVEAAKRAARVGAYEAAEPFITTARITRENFSGLMRNVKQGIEDIGIDREMHPKTVHTLQRLGRMFKKTKKADRLNITEVTLKRVETERKLINRALRGKMEPPDRNALLELQGAMDDWLESAYDQTLMSGDPAALEVLKRARREAHEYYSLFTKQRGRKVSDEVGTVMEKLLYADATPEQAINYIFGAGQLGKKGVSAGVVKRLKSIFGADSPEWAALRDVSWLKLTRKLDGSMKEPAKFVKDFDELFTNNKSLVDVLYTPDEITVLKGVRDGIEMMKIPPHATNPSKTAWTLMSTVRRLFHWRGTAQAVLHKRPLYGGLLHTIGRALPGAGPVFQSTAVKQAARQIPRPLPVSPPTVATGIAGARVGGE